MSQTGTETATYPLLRTKLHRPPAPHDLVQRPRLLERLDQRLQRPLTLVSAPAGYGKTTLVSHWLEAADKPSAWVSLDEYDNDLVSFLAYVLAAIDSIFPDTLGATHTLLSALSLPPVRVLARSLANELDQIEADFFLVLDDCHYITEPAIHELLARILRHPPRSMHLVLMSRRDPPLPLTQLRARGQVTEIRPDELRFTVAETSAFLQKMLDTKIDETTATFLAEKTEGWVTGLRLAVLSLRHRDEGDRLAYGQVVDTGYVTDYLLTEVLKDLPAATRNFLLNTCILDRLNGPLCDAVCFDVVKAPSRPSGTSRIESGELEHSSQAYLEWLHGRNLFTISLDDRKHWYRYHDMFQQLLQRQLERQFDADEIAGLHKRAGSWYAENGMIDEALRHALKAGEFFAASELLEHNVHTLLNEDRWHIVRRRLAQLPPDIVQGRPELLLAKAWVAYYQLAVETIPPILEIAEPLLDDSERTEPLRGQIEFFRGSDLYWQGQANRSLELLSKALERIPEAYHMARGEAEVFWGLASQMSGQKNRAVRAFNRRLYHGQPAHPSSQGRLLGALAFVHLVSGDLTEAATAAERIQDLGAKHKNAHLEAWGAYLQALVYYGWNDLRNAAHHFANAVELSYFNTVAAAIDSLAGLALCYQALEQPDKARATVDQLLEFAQETNVPAYMIVAHSFQARLSLMQGDLAVAMRWLATADLTTDTSAMVFWLEVPRLTQCRVLIAHGSGASLQEATDKLQKYAQENESQNNTFQLINITLLQALANQKRSRPNEAVIALEHAITLAEPGVLIRPFLDAGPDLAGLLGKLHGRGIASAHIGRILDAANAAERKRTLGHEFGDSLIEPLTDRELEVLSFFAQRLTNREIAQRLTISPGTVKRHAENIYRKLDVHGRREAVARAAELGSDRVR